MFKYLRQPSIVEESLTVFSRMKLMQLIMLQMRLGDLKRSRRGTSLLPTSWKRRA
jgi:hypothetical protein